MGSFLSSTRPVPPAVVPDVEAAPQPWFDLDALDLVIRAKNNFHDTIGVSAEELNCDTLEPPFYMMLVLILNCSDLLKQKTKRPEIIASFVRHSLVASGLLMARPEWNIDPFVITMGEVNRNRYGLRVDN